jgi:hypothetical protein
MTGKAGAAPPGAGAAPEAGAGTAPPAAGAAPAVGPAPEAGAAPAAGAGAAQAGTGAGSAAGAGAGPAAESGAEPAEAEPLAGVPESRLSDRLTALDRLIQIGQARSGPDGISEKVLNDAEQLLARAGQRLRMSSAHTVVALAGGTGSGKSSLFNRLAGADFSAVGVTRPVTRDTGVRIH